MGLFDDVVLDDAVLKLTREAYSGNAEIPAKGWQTKSLKCNLDTVKLREGGIEVCDQSGGLEYTSNDLTREIEFHKSNGKDRALPGWEWLQFRVMYIRGKLAAVVHIPEKKEAPK